MGTSLRLILLMVGIIILILVVWDVLKNQTKKLRTGKMNYRIREIEPNINLYETAKFNLESGCELVDPAFITDPKINIEPSLNTTRTTTQVDFFAINILARETLGFSGVNLLKEFSSSGLEFGKWNIFHKKYNTQILFSVASSKEPGVFKAELGANDYFPGISVFFVIPDSPNPQLALDEVVKFAKKIAFKLNGELLDKSNKPLTLQRLSVYRNNINNYKLAK